MMAGDGCRTIKRLSRRSIAILFLAAIALPLLGTWFDWDPWHALNEKRQLAKLPPLPRNWTETASFLPGVLLFYRDHFGFRGMLIHGLMRVEVGYLQTGGNHQVIVGEDGWLFIRMSDGAGSHDYDPLAPLSESELSDWQRIMRQRHDWLATRGISYLVVFAPEKQTIYPEFLPAAMRGEQSQHWMNQIIDRLHKANSPARILDLRPILLEAKQHEQVYWKADTHWNQYGNYVCYRAVMDEIQRILPGKPLIILGPKDFSRFSAEGSGGDLADLLGVPELFREEFNAMVLPHQILPQRGPDDALYIIDGDPHMPRLVMYHDSFGALLIPLMARSFSHGAYFWGKHNMRPDFIAEQQPDLVIDEFTERFLTASRWEEPEISDQSNLK